MDSFALLCFRALTHVLLSMRPKEQQQPDVESANCVRFTHSDGHELSTFTGKRHRVLRTFPLSLQCVSKFLPALECDQSSEWQQLPAAGSGLLNAGPECVQFLAAAARLHSFQREG